MAAKEVYDYVGIVASDNDETLTVTPLKVREQGYKNQVVHTGSDESEQVVDLGGGASMFYFFLAWSALSESDAGTLLDFYHDASKGNGYAESFKWDHPVDGHTYVVKFRSDVERAVRRATAFNFAEIKLKCMGKIAD